VTDGAIQEGEDSTENETDFRDARAIPGWGDGGTKISVIPAHILPQHHLSVAEIECLEDRLYGHNKRATGRDDGKGLAFVAIDEHRIQIGAIAGYSWAGMAEIKQLWVDESHRGHGLGRRLLEAAIAEAVARGCQSVWAMSYTFQAPGLYEKCGFDRVTELPDWPPGHAHIVLRLQLKNEWCREHATVIDRSENS
jgi:GNAT superfamily N-acetyltransferase